MSKLKYNNIKKIIIIENILDYLYPNPNSTLYYINEYTLLIAVILTSRSKEKKVNDITKNLFKIIQNPEDFISYSSERIKKYLNKIGLYNKKYNYIYNLSNILINKCNRIIPKDIYQLKRFPGVGHKTASVFLSHVSDIPVFPVDTHIHRMMYRWKLSIGKNVKKTEKDAKRIFEKKHWNKLHHQIINYAREYSPSKNWNKHKDVIYQELLNNHLL
ncbi:endonuclease III domain-containing protein [Blattabacterium cuenoti]|uniref:endonuclease III domain-containing protein n=1 Tax=Blattabacterium cuenoti TaxID=1653831 RepID=UPI00163BC8C8|nr:endonuclease III [Blattabacterium cuenoti]